MCGTQSYPRLSRTAYVGAHLFVQLNSQARLAFADPDYMKVNPNTKIVQLPEIFKCYEADFSASGKPGVLYVNQFRKAKAASVPT